MDQEPVLWRFDNSQNADSEMMKDEMVNLYVNNALDEVNKALSIVQQNGKDGDKQEIDFTANVAKLQA